MRKNSNDECFNVEDDDENYLAGFYESKMNFFEKCLNDNKKKK